MKSAKNAIWQLKAEFFNLTSTKKFGVENFPKIRIKSLKNGSPFILVPFYS